MCERDLCMCKCLRDSCLRDRLRTLLEFGKKKGEEWG